MISFSVSFTNSDPLSDCRTLGGPKVQNISYKCLPTSAVVLFLNARVMTKEDFGFYFAFEHQKEYQAVCSLEVDLCPFETLVKIS